MVNVAVRSLKDNKFHAKLQIISAELEPTVDIKSINPADEFRKVSKTQTKANMVNIRKE